MAASVCPACMLNSTAVLGEIPNGEDGIAGGDELLAPRPSSPVSGAVTQFGDYVLEKEIAHGGMGVVYRARQLKLDRTVAIKLLLLGRYSSGDSIKRFQREAQSIGALRHPGIVTVHEVGEYEGQHYIAMEYVDGPTLHGLLRAGPLTARRAAEITRDVARAVHYAHQRGVLHRDIKPSNVLLDSSGLARITDFGLAKKLDGSTDLTMTAQMVGTPNYLSPEQAAGRRGEVSPASDVYSMGALLYELVTGRPPFLADSLQETLLRIRDTEPVSPRALNPALDRDIETICLKCLEKDPRRRYASADALAEDLERCLRGEPIQARPCPPAMRLWKWTCRKPLVAVLTAISILAIVAFVVGQTVMGFRLSRANQEVGATNTRLSASLYELRWRKADEAALSGERDEAIAWFSYFLRQNPTDSTAAARLLSLLSSYNFPVLLHPPLRHESNPLGVEFNRTGDRLVSVTDGGIVRVWDVQSGKVETELINPVPVRLTAFALGGTNDQRVLTISAEPKARLWNLTQRQIAIEVNLGELGAYTPREVLTSRDGRLMAMNVDSNSVAVLEADSEEWVAPRLSEPDKIHGFALSEDGRQLATATRLGVQLWDVAGQRKLFAPVVLSAVPTRLQFSGNGQWLVCSSWGKIEVISTVTGARERALSVEGVPKIGFVGNENLIRRQDNSHLALFDIRTNQDLGSAFGQPQIDWFGHPSLAELLFSSKELDRLTMLDPATGEPHAAPFFHDGWIRAWRLHRSGKVATAAEDRTVRIWSVEMERAKPITVQVGGEVWDAQWSPSGERILSVSLMGGHSEIRLWDGQNGVPVTPPKTNAGNIHFAQWSPDGSRFATASQAARLWNGETAEPISPPLHHDLAVIDCTFSPDGTVLATGSDDPTVRLWDGRTGKALGAPLLHSASPLKLRFNRDGRRLASACRDGTIQIWSVPDGKLVVGPLHHDGTCWVAGFSPDDRLLVSASADGTARLWDASTGEPVLPPLRHEGPVLWASFSPDGQAIATSTETGIARVWSVRTGQPLSEPMRHSDRVWTVKWSADGKLLATICMDGAARIWDPATGHLVVEPFFHEKGKQVRRAGFSPDGRRFLSSSFDGTMKMWELTFLHPPTRPDWLPELAEALGGKRIGPKDIPEPVPGDSFQNVKARILKAGGQDFYARWARWMLQERLERPVKPFQP